MFNRDNSIYVFLLNAGIINPGTRMNDDIRNIQLFEAAVKSIQPEKLNPLPSRLAQSTLAYLAWTKEVDQLAGERRELREKRDQIRAACPHSFRYESNLKQVGMGVRRCVACRVLE